MYYITTESLANDNIVILVFSFVLYHHHNLPRNSNKIGLTTMNALKEIATTLGIREKLKFDFVQNEGVNNTISQEHGTSWETSASVSKASVSPVDVSSEFLHWQLLKSIKEVSKQTGDQREDLEAGTCIKIARANRESQPENGPRHRRPSRRRHRQKDRRSRVGKPCKDGVLAGGSRGLMAGLWSHHASRAQGIPATEHQERQRTTTNFLLKLEERRSQSSLQQAKQEERPV
ncbi:hypothetical protein YC2023_042210 [Brassica napus]